MKTMILQLIGFVIPFVRQVGGAFLPQRYAAYRAKIAQATTAAPTEGTVIENSTGQAMTWARTSIGLYTCTAAAACFSTTLTSVKIQSEAAAGAANQRDFSYVVTSTTVITVSVADSATPGLADSGNFFIEIETASGAISA